MTPFPTSESHSHTALNHGLNHALNPAQYHTLNHNSMMEQNHGHNALLKRTLRLFVALALGLIGSNLFVKTPQAHATIYTTSSASSAGLESETLGLQNTHRGNWDLGTLIHYTARSSNGTDPESWQFAPRAEFFLGDGFSLGVTGTYQQTQNQGKWTGVGPSAHLYFLRSGRWAPYLSQRVLFTRPFNSASENSEAPASPSSSASNASTSTSARPGLIGPEDGAVPGSPSTIGTTSVGVNYFVAQSFALTGSVNHSYNLDRSLTSLNATDFQAGAAFYF